MELWAEATREIADIDSEVTDFTFYLKVIQYNETVPVIVANQEGVILDHRNLNPSRIGNTDYLNRQILLMEKKNEPIEVEFFEDERLYIYYNDSRILVWLAYYPMYSCL
jgi:two-component system, sporulation sensor kinase D